MLNNWAWSRSLLSRCHHFQHHSYCSKNKIKIRNLMLLLGCGALLVFLYIYFKRPKEICVKKVFNVLDLNKLAKDTSIENEKDGSSVKQQIIAYENSWKSYVFKRKQAILEFGHIYEENPWSMNGERTFWDFWQAHYNCPHVSERVGRVGKGGKWICGITHLAKKPTPCIVYSFGIDDLSFVEEFLYRTDCHIFIYDPSIHSNQNTSNQLQKNLVKYPKRLHFTNMGIGSKNMKTSFGFLGTLGSLMKANGHIFIDILNLDIDGAEYSILNQIMDEFSEGLPFAQLQVEFHIFDDIYSESNNHISYAETKKTIVRGQRIFKDFSEFWKKLEKAGLRPFHSEPNLLGYAFGWRYLPCYDYSFINIRVDNHLLRPFK